MRLQDLSSPKFHLLFGEYETKLRFLLVYIVYKEQVGYHTPVSNGAFKKTSMIMYWVCTIEIFELGDFRFKA